MNIQEITEYLANFIILAASQPFATDQFEIGKTKISFKYHILKFLST